MNLDKLKTELSADPLSRGYSTMTTDEIMTSLMTADRVVNKTSMSGDEIASAINKTEYNALTNEEKDRVIGATLIDSLDPFGFVAVVITDIFAPGSTTITNLVEARKKTISRAEEIGYRKVRVGWIEAVK